MISLHAVAVVGVAWFLFGGMDIVASWVGTKFHHADLLRRCLLLSLSIIYFLRVLATVLVMLNRRVSYGEALIVEVWILFIHGALAFLGGTNAATVGWLTWLGVVLYVIGSYLNSGSEYQRLRWKQAPEHHGKLYTEGLFKYAMHINYFGDVVLFIGFALVTGRTPALLIPAIMVALFVCINIPKLDQYLAGRYGEAFEDYSATTAKLVPFVY